ncbi:MAG TPA: hypothetical protein VGM21_20270 [Actinomycetota bacterium]|jgi:hypothetical protein
MKELGGKADRRLLREVVGQFRPYRAQVLLVACSSWSPPAWAWSARC